MLDVIIRNGKIIDGSGKKAPQKADVGIKDGEIIEIGNLEKEVSTKEINASGKYVVPGFVDINNHSDTSWTLFRYPDQESMVMQGVTTIIGGNCGSSLAPILGEGSIKSLRKWVSLRDIQIDWDRMSEFLDYMEDNRPLRINFGTLVGHATLRRGLIGDEIRPLKTEEVKIIAHQLERAIKEGAWGMSSGLMYTHAKIAQAKEIEKLAQTVKYNDGVFSVHLRGEGHDIVLSVKEAIEIAKKTGVSIEISHLKAVGKKSWHLFNRALELIKEARSEGLNINFDVYPYTSSGPVLYTLLPEWATEGGREKLLKLLKNKKTRDKVILEIKENSFNYSQIIIASSPLSKLLVSKSIEEIAKSRGASAEEVIVDLILASEDQCNVIVKLLAENNVQKALSFPGAIVASDGIGYGLREKESVNIVHPRCFGAFPRFLNHYVKQKNILTIPKAIYKMTGLPAKKIGIKDRGMISEGYKADIVVLDWKNIKDESHINAPYRFPEGINHVIVNGEIVVDKGKLTEGVRPGKILRKS